MPEGALCVRRACLVWLGALAISGLLFALWDSLYLDVAVSRHWGSAAGFPLKDHAIWGTGLYQLQRIIGWTCMALVVWMVFKPPAFASAFVNMPRARRRFMLASIIAALLLVQWLKRHSLTSCPWDYQIFGGMAQVVSHWRFGLGDGGPGRCFPAGHPSGGFAFVSVAVFLSLNSPRWAAWSAVVFIVLGSAMGLTQIARGAHFVSHVMWSAWWCTAVALLGLFACIAWERRARANADGP